MIYLPGIKEAVKLYKGPKYVYYYDHKNKESFAPLYSDCDAEMGNYEDFFLLHIFLWFPLLIDEIFPRPHSWR